MAAGKVAGAVEAAGGIGGMTATASQLASKAGEVIKSTVKAAIAKGEALSQHVIEGMGGAPELATAGGGRLEMRATPEAIRPTGSSGTRDVNGVTSAEASAGAKATTLLEGKNPETITGLHPNANTNSRAALL